MLITISLLILAYLIMGKDIKPLLERVKNIDWRGKINALMDKLRPWALKAGRAATRPLSQHEAGLIVGERSGWGNEGILGDLEGPHSRILPAC